MTAVTPAHAAESILIFGGTFDPPHRAHVELPRLVARRLGCDRIIYVPTSSNPLKGSAPTEARHRLAMLRLALADRPDCTISTFEIERAGPSYTVDLLEHLRAEHGPSARFHLLLGADAALSFHRWRQPDRILELATPAVILRPPGTREKFRKSIETQRGLAEARDWDRRVVEVPTIDVSASELRRRLAAGEDVGDAMPPSVLEYIRLHGLYQSS